MGRKEEIYTIDDFDKEIAVDVLARTLWGEARSEGTKGMTAVACAILNRIKIAAQHNGRYWWGHDMVSVCQKPYQFSCWNVDDPNRKKVMHVAEDDIHFATAMRIARRAVYNVMDDITHGATHYHTVDIMPFWAKGEKPCARIGRHIFYRLEA